MKRCTVLRPSSFRALSHHQAQRWHTYDKASLTKEALRQKVEAGLGSDADGESLKLDTEAKTISTAAGDLPISPIFDPAWMQARRKTAKAAPGPPLGRFRQKLANNPFARALATPIRRCPNSATSLPRYFLQDFELIKHPTTGTAWWAPGPLAFEHVLPTKRLDETQTDMNNRHDGETSALDPMSASAVNPEVTTTHSETDAARPRRAPITSYTLNRKSLVDMVGGPNKRYLSLLLAVRSGMAVAPDSKNAIWREDMGDMLLRMMRKQAADALIVRGNRLREPQHKFIQPCASWEDVQGVRLRGCVLWLPEKKGAAEQYATLDVEGAQYGKKMVVHNLDWLLGEEESIRRIVFRSAWLPCPTKVSITTSPPFTFVVGPDQKEYTIHSALVAQQSKVLNALVNGQMKEAVERRVIWKDVDEETFVHFSQYVYTGDYGNAEPKEAEVKPVVIAFPPVPNNANSRERAEALEWGMSRLGLDSINGLTMIEDELDGPTIVSPKKKDLLWAKFQMLYPSPPTPVSVARTDGPHDDFDDVFLCHVQVYFFAEYYGIEALQTLALHKLCKALMDFNLHVKGCGDVARLIQYCFDETADRGEQTNALRSLVCLYAACKVEDLWKVTEFQDLMGTLPEFSAGLVTAMLERLD
ncbi:hypothetical protein TARUN_411 [Trichoderma arundinaceum]|uniref:BTB domain-containing protein n=1 Tax=Trichoderma arundinaceum TaxID=490622 RepID=A0A395P0F1_TRIAR|nr:hypothetical protein TARUN_411 [Trichoderma arundinaceum]